MTWRETDVTTERMKFVLAALADEESITSLCEEFGISRKTGHKWLGRYEAQGPMGLHDRPRSPVQHGRATASEVVDLIVAEKHAHLAWGPKKLLIKLKQRYPDIAWPAVSTAGEILKRHGLVMRRKRRHRACGNGPWPLAEGANTVWTADHKGWFRTRDGKRCEPLTVMDTASRYLLGLAATGSTCMREAWPVFERLFKEYGLPDRLRSDNGVPFASSGVTGLTGLSVRFVKLGIGLERIDPGKPQQNGRHERFHGNLVPLARKPKASCEAQQQAFDVFRREYNEERPHEALGQAVPAERYRPSSRAMPDRLPEPNYPAEATVRRVRASGEIRWQGGFVYISEALIGEPLAIKETEAGDWSVRFYAHPIGIIDRAQNKLRRHAVSPLKGRDSTAQTTPEL